MAVIAGVNVGNLFHTAPATGWFDAKRLNAYVSGFALNRKFNEVDAKYMGVGIGGQYRLFEAQNWLGRSVKWTGLEVGAGILYTKLQANANVSLNGNYKANSNGTDYNVTVAGTNALFNANVKTFTVPLEVSTGLRLFYVLKLVGGLGVDLNFGKTEGEGHLASATGTVSADDGFPPNPDFTANPDFSVSGSEGPSLLNARVFIGPHIEFGVGSVFVNIQKSLFQKTIALNTGLNLFW